MLLGVFLFGIDIVASHASRAAKCGRNFAPRPACSQLTRDRGRASEDGDAAAEFITALFAGPPRRWAWKFHRSWSRAPVLKWAHLATQDNWTTEGC